MIPLKPHKVEVVNYHPNWTDLYLVEKEALLTSTGNHFVEIEHMGSTAIPNQRAKPIIDIMAAIHQLAELDIFLPDLNLPGYQLIDAGMSQRFFLGKVVEKAEQTCHLHIVELSIWSLRKERLMWDYLLEHPGEVKAYGDLKAQLAVRYKEDSIAYTEAKTGFIQDIIDKARDELGLPRIGVSEE